MCGTYVKYGRVRASRPNEACAEIGGRKMLSHAVVSCEVVLEKYIHLCTLDYLQAGFINMGQELSVLRHYLASGKCLDLIEDPAGCLVDLLNGLMFIFFTFNFWKPQK